MAETAKAALAWQWQVVPTSTFYIRLLPPLHGHAARGVRGRAIAQSLSPSATIVVELQLIHILDLWPLCLANF